eukprot:22634_1
MSVSVPSIELICSVFGLIICSSVIIALFIKLVAKYHAILTSSFILKSDDKIIGIVTAISLGFYGFGCVIACFFLLLYIYFDIDNYDAMRALIWIFGGGFYLMGQWLLLLSFVMRLDMTFKHAPFIRFNHVHVKCGYLAVSSLFILIVAMWITVALKQRVATVVMVILWAIIHFAASVVMLILFLSKVFEVMRYKASFELQQDSGLDEDERDDAPKQITIKLNDVKSATRYALLVSIATTSTFISLIVMVIVTLVHETDAFDNEKELGALEYLFVGIDSMVNAFCLYFLFEFNKTQYYDMCECCHGVVEKCCVHCVVGKFAGIEDQNEEHEAIDYEDLILR